MNTIILKRPNVKLTKLVYKYMEEPKEITETVKEAAETVKEETEDEKKKEYESYPPYNFSWFVENKIAAMGWPQTVENLNYLADVGINHLVTLSPERIPPITEFGGKLKWSEIRIKEFGVPTLKQILKFIDICERAEINGEVLGVHCRHGRGRTGTMLACYLVHFKHMTPERAVLTVRVQRPGSCETYEQEKIVCYYHDCERGTITKPDYRLVDDKLYFDYTMKYMYEDDDDDEDDFILCDRQDDDPYDEASIAEKVETMKMQMVENKSKAMVINHKLYF